MCFDGAQILLFYLMWCFDNCSSSAHRAPGKNATAPIYKVLVRPGRDSNPRKWAQSTTNALIEQLTITAFTTKMFPRTSHVIQDHGQMLFKALWGTETVSQNRAHHQKIWSWVCRRSAFSSEFFSLICLFSWCCFLLQCVWCGEVWLRVELA